MLARCLPHLLLDPRRVARGCPRLGGGRRPASRDELRSAAAPHRHSRAIVGGGVGCLCRELTLAHRGVLFLDELAIPALFSSPAPAVEEGGCTWPQGVSVRFLAIPDGAAPILPCGYAGDRLVACTCSPAGAARYRGGSPAPSSTDSICRWAFPLAPTELRPGGEPARWSGRESSGPARGRAAGRQPVPGARRLDACLAGGGGAAALGGRALALTGRGWDRVRRWPAPWPTSPVRRGRRGHVAEA